MSRLRLSGNALGQRLGELLGQPVGRESSAFDLLKRPELAPREAGGVIECWLKPGESRAERNLDDPAHCDFWRAAHDVLAGAPADKRVSRLESDLDRLKYRPRW